MTLFATEVNFWYRNANKVVGSNRLYIQEELMNGHRKVLVRLPEELIAAIDNYVDSQAAGTATRASIIAQTLSEAFPLAMGPGYRYAGQYRAVGWRGKHRPTKTATLEDVA